MRSPFRDVHPTKGCDGVHYHTLCGMAWPFARTQDLPAMSQLERVAGA